MTALTNDFKVRNSSRRSTLAVEEAGEIPSSDIGLHHDLHTSRTTSECSSIFPKTCGTTLRDFFYMQSVLRWRPLNHWSRCWFSCICSPSADCCPGEQWLEKCSLVPYAGEVLQTEVTNEGWWYRQNFWLRGDVDRNKIHANRGGSKGGKLLWSKLWLYVDRIVMIRQYCLFLWINKPSFKSNVVHGQSSLTSPET